MKFNRLIGLLIVVMILSACQPTKSYLGDPELPYPPERKPVIGDILHLPTGVYVTQQEMLEQILRVQVIFVGETHDNPASHRLQEEILAALQQHNPGQITLAMEMFGAGQQAVLDRWVAGELSEKKFLKQVGWYQNWRMNFAFYRNLLNYCRDHQIPILALNTTEEIRQKVGSTPFEELAEADRQRLPQMDQTDPYHMAMVKSFYAGHKMGQAMEAGFQRVQTLWDETMAESLANYLKEHNRTHQVLVIAGGNHVRYGFGIPRRMFRRIPSSYQLIGSEELNIPEDKRDRLMNVNKPAYPMPPYHFMTFTAYEDLPQPGVKLGIMLDKAEGGLLIKGIIPGSVAEHNGLLENDLLIQIDSQQLLEPFDLIYELQQKKLGDTAELHLLRQGEPLVKSIELKENSQHPNM